MRPVNTKIALLAWLGLAALAAARAVCHDTLLHPSGDAGCEQCIDSAGDCMDGAHCWPDGTCRAQPPFFMHVTEAGAGPGAHLLHDGAEIDVAIRPALPGAIEAVTLLRVDVCTCDSPRHSDSAHRLLPLDRRRPDKTGCRSPGAVVVHTWSPDTRPWVARAAAPQHNAYYAEAVLAVIAPPGPYVAGTEASHYRFEYRVAALDGGLRIVCRPGYRFDTYTAACRARPALFVRASDVVSVVTTAIGAAVIVAIARRRVQRAAQVRARGPGARARGETEICYEVRVSDLEVGAQPAHDE